LNVNVMKADLLALSAHKIGGPKGVGALYIRRGTAMKSWQRGGAQERGRRAGTENVPGIVGFGAAARAALRDLDANAARLTQLRERLEAGLVVLPHATINGMNAPRAPHICNVSLGSQSAEMLTLNLDLKGFAVGTGSACASGAIEASHVLTAMGLSQEAARASLRVSMGVQNTVADIDEFVASLVTMVTK
jgi:cysteine desulfurase